MSERFDNLPARDDALAGLARGLGDAPAGVWLVGGAVRDLLLGRALADVDLAVAGDARTVAGSLHTSLGGDIFSLSDRFGTWRVQPAGASWRADITALRGGSIEEDLSLRDFAVNAMALPAGGGELIDPFGGAADAASRTLRVLGARAYADDPLRPLRMPRFASTLAFEPDDETARLTADHAASVTTAAPERIFAELRELVRGQDVLRGIELLAASGLMDAVLPELSALRGVEQSAYHHLDAYDHTLEVLGRLIETERDPAAVFGESASALRSELDRPLADELTRGEALRWAALLHDVAKSTTRTVFPNGRVGFPRHDEFGAETARSIARRLHTSDRFASYVAALTREHLRLGYLVHTMPLTRREVYRYLKATEPVEVEVNVLSAADRLATRGRKADDSIASHLELVRVLTSAGLARRTAAKVDPLLRGDELARALAIEPGPRLGELLEEIDEARYCGDVSTVDEAIDFARKRIGRPE